MNTLQKRRVSACVLAAAFMLAAAPAVAGQIPRADAAEEDVRVYADWKFEQSAAEGSLENNDLVLRDESGNGNDLELVVSDNGASAADFLAFEDVSMTGDAGSMKFMGLTEEDQQQMNALSGAEREALSSTTWNTPTCARQKTPPSTARRS